MSDILTLRGIDKRFGGVHAVRDVSFSFAEGEVCALMGENGAGKSTLGKILCGVHHPDAGELLFRGRPVVLRSPFEAQQLGIGMIFQELDLFPSLSIAENMMIGNLEFGGERGGWLRYGAVERLVSPWLEKVGLAAPPRRILGTLSMAEVQLVAIARALSQKASLLVMDEPTSSLTDDAVDNLFSLVRSLKEAGTTIIYVSHRMDEIFRIADAISVMRDGAYIGTVRTAETTPASVVEMVVGRPLGAHGRARSHRRDDVTLSVRGLTTGKLHGVSFDLHRGEVLGLAGLVGSGRSEVGQALFGLDRVRSGTIARGAVECRFDSPESAIRRGVGLVPEDRKLQGLMMQMSVKENMSFTVLSRFQRLGFTRDRALLAAVGRIFEATRIKAESPATCVNNLSGGNQQKVLLGRWLLADPEVLFLDDPTRGVDVGAKEDIYAIIEDLAASGKSLLFVSSELPELIRCCDRILVLHEGRLAATLDSATTSQQEIMMAAAQVDEMPARAGRA